MAYYHKFLETFLQEIRILTHTAPGVPRDLDPLAARHNFIKYTGVNFWNVLELSIPTNSKIGSFKTHLKNYINRTLVP